ncbi:CBS domain-containing protein CBSX5-like [Gossypium australe]|uniref:CBS domain-containing protein CBSX5-like n=1 Tax=Gossypium australe TaxID=47621 RepID=A0A5B6X1H7_9ROSI|nr:CBS domain-containing protein CBSX5-like [Gossypium australe]
MCKRLEDGLNEEIRLSVGILELKEKKFAGKSHQSALEKSREYHPRFTAFAGISIKDRDTRHFNSKPQTTSIVSLGSVRNVGLECKHCNKRHYGECRISSGACFKCGSLDHYLQNCPKKSIDERDQPVKASNMATRGRPPRNIGIRVVTEVLRKILL